MSENQDAQVALFSAVSGLAAVFARDLDLARLDENETSDAHATRLLEAMRPKAEELQTARDEFEAERDTLKRQVAAFKGQATRAKAAATALEAQVPKKPRKFDTAIECMTAADLSELVEDADAVELAFVGADGQELKGLAPRTITGDAFRDAGHALLLQVPSLTVHGPGPEQPAVTLEGYALVLDGEQVAYAPRIDQLTIGNGSKFELKDDVAFPVKAA